MRSPIPLVAIALDDLPTSMYAGEVRQTALVVTNTGQVPLVALRGLCSLPSFAIFCEEGERDVYPVVGSIEGEGKTVPNHLASNTPFTVPLGGPEATLEPGASIRVPLVCRADVEGVHNLCWLFVFQAKVRLDRFFPFGGPGLTFSACRTGPSTSRRARRTRSKSSVR